MINVFAAGTVPAAVIIIGMAWPNIAAASITALYPAKLAWLDSTSIDWAREMRGMNSIAISDMPLAASASRPGRSSNGESMAATMAPGFK